MKHHQKWAIIYAIIVIICLLICLTLYFTNSDDIPIIIVGIIGVLAFIGFLKQSYLIMIGNIHPQDTKNKYYKKLNK